MIDFDNVPELVGKGTGIANRVILFLTKIATFWKYLDWYERLLLIGVVGMIGWLIYELWKHRDQIDGIKF